MQPRLRAEDLSETHPRLRADRLRMALRGDASLRAVALADPAAWIELLREADDPALVVLLLELLEGSDDERLLTALEKLRTDRAEGVRLASLRMICDREPHRVAGFVDEYRYDSNLELRFLLGTRLYESERERGVKTLLATLAEESGGLREQHALERVLGFLVEEKHEHSIFDRLVEMREDFDDPEDYFGWALAQLESTDEEP